MQIHGYLSNLPKFPSIQHLAAIWYQSMVLAGHVKCDSVTLLIVYWLAALFLQPQGVICLAIIDLIND